MSIEDATTEQVLLSVRLAAITHGRLGGTDEELIIETLQEGADIKAQGLWSEDYQEYYDLLLRVLDELSDGKEQN